MSIEIVTATNFCYQESANVSTTCGGLNTGKYWLSYAGSTVYNPTYAIDENWSTYANLTVGMFIEYVNYSIPSNSLNVSLWQVSYGLYATQKTTTNLTIPKTCLNGSTLQLQVSGCSYYQCTDTNYYCYSNAWTNLLHISWSTIYEEAMWWNISDIIAPTYSFNNTNLTTYINGTWAKLSINWTDETMLNFTWIGSNFSGTWINETPVARAGLTTINHTNSTLISAGYNKNICWASYANDTSGNFNQTGIMCFNTTSGAQPDTTSPNSANPLINNSNPKFNEIVLLNMTWTDDVNLSGYILFTNISGNYSFVSFSGTTNYSNYTITINVTRGNNVTWYFFANDTSGNMNVSLPQYFIVANTPPDIANINLPLNNSNFSTKSIEFNYSAIDIDNDALQFILYLNGTYNSTQSLQNITFNFSSDGYYYFEILSSDTFNNATSNSSKRYFIIDTTPPTIENIQNHSITSTSTIINFTVNELSNFSINYGTSTDLGTMVSNTTFIIGNREYVLTGLLSSTTYFYNISVWDSLGNSNTEGAFNFTTLTNVTTATPPSGGGGGGAMMLVFYNGTYYSTLILHTINATLMNWKKMNNIFGNVSVKLIYKNGTEEMFFLTDFGIMAIVAPYEQVVKIEKAGNATTIMLIIIVLISGYALISLEIYRRKRKKKHIELDKKVYVEAVSNQLTK